MRSYMDIQITISVYAYNVFNTQCTQISRLCMLMCSSDYVHMYVYIQNTVQVYLTMIQCIPASGWYLSFTAPACITVLLLFS